MFARGMMSCLAVGALLAAGQPAAGQTVFVQGGGVQGITIADNPFFVGPGIGFNSQGQIGVVLGPDLYPPNSLLLRPQANFREIEVLRTGEEFQSLDLRNQLDPRAQAQLRANRALRRRSELQANLYGIQPIDLTLNQNPLLVDTNGLRIGEPADEIDDPQADRFGSPTGQFDNRRYGGLGRDDRTGGQYRNSFDTIRERNLRAQEEYQQRRRDQINRFSRRQFGPSGTSNGNDRRSYPQQTSPRLTTGGLEQGSQGIGLEGGAKLEVTPNGIRLVKPGESKQKSK